jgi:hypothetical protein
MVRSALFGARLEQWELDAILRDAVEGDRSSG